MSRWVCLMYHDVLPDSTVGGDSKQYFSVSRAGFERQLDRLADLGYRVCSVEEAAASPSTNASRLVACSFDDGDAGQFERAFPALAARKMTATFFITTDWVGQSKYISWAGLREMKAAGMSLQSHTRSHPFLSELDEPALRRELRDSREALDAQLSQRTTSIALPGGDPPRRALTGVLADEGYAIVATSRWGVNRSSDRQRGPVWINRCTVRGEMPDETFRRVADGDPWLSGKKRVREGVLRVLRNSLGPTRYALLRRRWMDGTTSHEAT